MKYAADMFMPATDQCMQTQESSHLGDGGKSDFAVSYRVALDGLV